MQGIEPHAQTRNIKGLAELFSTVTFYQMQMHAEFNLSTPCMSWVESCYPYQDNKKK
jgi:hypothetical protein